MSVASLHKSKIYVLGPLELAPNQFAVGERSYAAIRGNMPYYNDMRQKFYLNGEKEFGDAIGELEARALAAEEALAKMTAARKSSDRKVELLTKELKKYTKNTKIVFDEE